MTDTTEIQSIIEDAFERRAEINPRNVDATTREAVMTALELLNQGKVRVATQRGVGDWEVHQWLKKAVLLSFRINDNVVLEGGFTQYYDKVPSKYTGMTAEEFAAGGVRVVPSAMARHGSYVAPGAVLMPSYVNIGAYVGSGTMVDTWSTVGSCAQIGKNVHLSGGVGNIAPAERSGVETVPVRLGGGGDNRAIELRVVAHGDVEPAGACKDAGLLLHGGIIAGHFIAAVVNAGGAAHRAEGEAAARAGVLLFAVVAVGVLFADEGQVTPDIRHHGFTAGLRPGEGGVAAADDAERLSGVHRGLGVGGAVAVLFPLAAVDIGGDVDAQAAGAIADTHARAAAVAFVFTVERGGVQGRYQVHVLARL